MKYTFICYPKCGTCQKAKKWLETKDCHFETRHIVEEKLSAEELKKLWNLSGQDLKKFFNTSGILYRDLALKDKLPTMTDEEKLDLLSSNGMLVKRPLITDGKKVLIGFKEAEWETELTK